MNNTTLPSINPVENPKARYALAKAWNRIFARAIDTLLLTLVISAIAILIIYTDAAGLSGAFDLTDKWRYFLIGLESCMLMFFYFLIIPLWTKGRTLGLFIFKLKIYNLIPTRNFFINLIKREFFLWIILALTNLALGITLWVMKNPTDFLKALLLQTTTDDSKTKLSAGIFQTLWGISGVFLVIVIIHMCIFNKRRCFIDHISDTVVIKLVDISSNDPNASANAKMVKNKRNYGLPGEIVAGAEDEINSL
ncbi:MAG: RDD family protein [Mycoplasmataceae bacterium]|nr:RDD family protein [Mycoplasmataceae bacterium]